MFSVGGVCSVWEELVVFMCVGGVSSLPEIAIQTAVITLIPFIATLTLHTIRLSWKRQEPLLSGRNHWLTYSRARSDHRCSLCF